MTNMGTAFRTIIESTSLDERAMLVTALRDYKDCLEPWTQERKAEFDGAIAQALKDSDQEDMLTVLVDEVIAGYFLLKDTPGQVAFADFLKEKLPSALFEKLRTAVAEDAETRLRYIWQNAKHDRDVSEEERALVHDMFWGVFEGQFHYGVYAYALLFDCDDKGLQRYRTAFEYFRENDVFDERAAAVITAVCNYWHSASYLEPELRAVLKEWPMEEEPTVCIAAMSYFAGLTFETKSQERLEYLKAIAFERFDDAEWSEVDLLKEAVIDACYGIRAWRRDLLKMIHTKEDLLRFEFQ